MRKQVLLYGLFGGVLIAGLKLVEYGRARLSVAPVLG